MAADSLADTLLRHATYLDRVASGVIKDSVDPAMIAIAIAVRQALADYAPDMSRIEFIQMRSRIRQIADTQLRAMMTTVTNQMTDISLAEATYFAGIVEEFAAKGVSVAIPLPTSIALSVQREMVLTAGASSQVGTWSEFVAGTTQAQTQLIDNTIRAGYADAQTKTEIVKRLVGTGKLDYSDGLIINRAKRQIETLVRTGINHYSNEAKRAVTEQNEDIVEGYVFLNVFDNRTTLTCLHFGELAATGKIYKVDDPDTPRPPLHYNCRSQLIFKVQGLDPFAGRMASVGGQDTAEAAEAYNKRQERLDERRDAAAERRAEGLPAKEVSSKVTRKGRADDTIFKAGTISADTSPSEFLKQQPRWFVESTLGKSRAALFLDGNLPIEKFTDMQGSPLTLSQLRAMDDTDAAFRRAGL
jgi:SPP1 gp7 family putative phage head morphogenesis protein